MSGARPGAEVSGASRAAEMSGASPAAEMSGASRGADVRLRFELAGTPASVALVRSVIGTVASAAGLERHAVEDILTAVSEACNNVVLHAYHGAPGPLIFSLTVEDGSIDAVVRDHGSGIHPGASGRNRGLGMGLTLINTLSDRAEFRSSQMGTEVRMRFVRPLEAAAEPLELSSGLWELTDLPRSSGALPARSG